jgi:hypothetical protein
VNPFDVLQQALDGGLRRSARLAQANLRPRTAGSAHTSKRQFIFVSNAIDDSGASQVLLQAVADFAERYRPSQLHVVAPAITNDRFRELTELGVLVDPTTVIGTRLAGRQLGMQRDDFLLMNTTSIPRDYQAVVLRALSRGTLEHAFWFVHEEIRQLRHDAPLFFAPAFLRQIRVLVEQERLTIATPSIRVADDYNELLSTTKVRNLALRIDVPDGYRHARSAADYEQLDFLIVGAPAVGVNDHWFTLAAFTEFLLSDYPGRPERYRRFTLTLIGIGKDYLSRQVRVLGTSVLGDRLRLLPSLAHEGVLTVVRGCNAVICSSLTESFALVVAEGMAMGHVVLRSDTGGLEEQLEPGVNGFPIDLTDVRAFAAVIEQILNKETTTSEQLRAMGAASQQIIEPYRHGSYVNKFEGLREPAHGARQATPAEPARTPTGGA